MASTIENLYKGDGYNSLFPFTFQYVKADDVKVSINDIDTNEYSLSNATTVQLAAAPPLGSTVRVYRETDTTAVPSTFYSGSTITAKGLNDNFAQTLFVAQEVQDAQANALNSIEVAEAAQTAADNATATAESATAAANVAIDTANAATTTALAAQTASTTAEANASAALTAASAAEDNIQEAIDASDAAVAASNAVVDTAAGAETTANNALVVANQAAADVDALELLISEGPVTSVNGQTGTVVLATSDLTNDSGYITLAEVPTIDITTLPVLP